MSYSINLTKDVNVRYIEQGRLAANTARMKMNIINKRAYQKLKTLSQKRRSKKKFRGL
jgi:hypothetical protein